LLNTIAEKNVYGREEELSPPTPHFTDGIPEVEIDTDQILSTGQLPTENLQ